MSPSEINTAVALEALKTEVKRELAKTEKVHAATPDGGELFHKSLWMKEIATSLRAMPANVVSTKLPSVAIKNSSTGCNEEILLNIKLTVKENASLFEKKSIKLETQAASERQTYLAVTQRRETLGEAYEALKSLSKETLSTDQHEMQLKEIQAQLSGTGSTTSNPQKSPPSLPFRHYTYKGFTIYAGKTDDQNDLLSTRYTAQCDLWFHAAHCPGSHVVLKHSTKLPQADSDTIARTAALTAWFSKSRNAPSADVHYTEGRFVHKRKGAPAGEVQLEKFRTIKVQPQSPEQLFM